MESKTTDNALERLKLISFISLIAFIVSLTFSLTTIYNRFLYLENEINEINEKYARDLDNIHRRIDTKTSRNETRIKQLEKSGSDK